MGMNWQFGPITSLADRMAEPYLERLSQIVEKLGQVSPDKVALETKHFFSGAALYANGKICASLSPSGFAVKLPAKVRQELMSDGNATEFRFFESGPIKREYVVLSDAIVEDREALQKLIEMSVGYTLGVPNPRGGRTP
jgi:TfoX/Sxy family transcriptional regulator of competence genes